MNRLVAQYYNFPERFTHLVPECEFLVGLGRLLEPYFKDISIDEHDRAAAEEERGSELLRKVEEAIQDLRYERYASDSDHALLRSPIATVYYFFRPILPRAIRQYFQRAYLSRWTKLTIPHWPVDTTVDTLLSQLLVGMLRSEATTKQIPFIWFWPDGASSCAIMTHDVETDAGLKRCSALMDIDASFGLPAAYQIVPEGRYHVPAIFIDEVKKHGCEVNIQDLNHDGLLFRNEREFRRRAERINAYGDKFGARGFRSAVLYRNHAWLSALRFEYDMSVPNVAHLDPQRGGCCTVMPYFVDHILELPVTTTQDYSLFHILNQYSLDLWKEQIELIKMKNGLISFIVHPDYLTNPNAIQIYRELLSYLAELRKAEGIWVTTPGEVNDWWRQRAKLRIVENGTGFRVEGPGSERARIAYAEEHMGQLTLSLEGHEVCQHRTGHTEVVSIENELTTRPF